MKYIILLLIGILLTFQNIGAETLEISVPYKKINDVAITTFRFTTGGIGTCQWRYYDGDLCVFWGVHYLEIKTPDPDFDIKFFGVDVYARMRAGPIWQRLGFGFGFFSDTDENIRTPWDFHLSYQAGIMIYKSIGFHAGIDHWSNGRSFAEYLGLDSLWPKYNDGGNAINVGLTYKFKF